MGNEIKATKINPPVLAGFAQKVLYHFKNHMLKRSSTNSLEFSQWFDLNQYIMAKPFSCCLAGKDRFTIRLVEEKRAASKN